MQRLLALIASPPGENMLDATAAAAALELTHANVLAGRDGACVTASPSQGSPAVVVRTRVRMQRLCHAVVAAVSTDSTIAVAAAAALNPAAAAAAATAAAAVASAGPLAMLILSPSAAASPWASPAPLSPACTAAPPPAEPAVNGWSVWANDAAATLLGCDSGRALAVLLSDGARYRALLHPLGGPDRADELERAVAQRRQLLVRIGFYTHQQSGAAVEVLETHTLTYDVQGLLVRHELRWVPI